jgi:xylulokinase
MLEGLALHARWIAQEQFRLAGLDAPSITVLGAPAATNTAWLQIKAQVMPWPLRAVTVAEPVAAGAALLAAERAGLIAAPASLERRPVVSTGPGYDRSFARFVAAARKEQA